MIGLLKNMKNNNILENTEIYAYAANDLWPCDRLGKEKEPLCVPQDCLIFKEHGRMFNVLERLSRGRLQIGSSKAYERYVVQMARDVIIEIDPDQEARNINPII